MVGNKYARKQRITQPLKNVVDLLEEFARYLRVPGVVVRLQGVGLRVLERSRASRLGR